MPSVQNDSGEIEFGGPATYRIVVQGTVKDSWGERLAGLAITYQEQEGRATKTILTGAIRDQAELAGVIDALYGMHLPIVSVEKIGSE